VQFGHQAAPYLTTAHSQHTKANTSGTKELKKVDMREAIQYIQPYEIFVHTLDM
jgi:hypothetical protein